MFLKWLKTKEYSFEKEKDIEKYVAKVPNTFVTFVAWTDGRESVAEVYVGSSPPASITPGTLVTGWHASGDLNEAKRNCLEAFSSWAGMVSIIATTDGHGNYDPLFEIDTPATRSGKLTEIADQLANVRDWSEIPEETEAGINGVLDALNDLIDTKDGGKDHD